MTAALALSRELVGFALGEVASDALASAVERLLARAGGRFEVEGADALADVIEARAGHAREPMLAALARAEGPTARYASARLLAAWQRPGEAMEQLSAALGGLPEPEPHLLALRARWRLRAGDVAGAARDLRLALQMHPGYAFHARAEKLVDKLIAAGACVRRRCKLAVLASSTTALLAPVLRASFFRAGIALEVYEATYGGYRQEILEPGSGLYAFEPDVVLLLVNHRDVALPPDGGQDRALAFGEELRALWTALQSRRPCHIIQVAPDTPADGAWGALEDTLPEGRRRVMGHLCASLAASLPPAVSLLRPDVLAARGGPVFFSEHAWNSTRQYPASEALPLFADAVVAHARAALGLSSKVLVLDLDNTLWGGVIGEDGLGGIELGPPDATGEGYVELQRYALELNARGVLLAVCSKNNPADAELPFRKHEGMVLKLEHFVSFRANWDDKASNLRAMAAELSLGLDSFVFLDDNPLERAWVRSALPEVEVPEARATPWDLLTALRRGMFFEATVLTREDRERHRSYEASSAMRVAQAGGATLEDFLAGLGMRAEHGPVDEATVVRVSQLINKTNQFNTTTRRYSAEEVRRMAADPSVWMRWFRLSDRFGDHGLIGVIIARREPGAWRIDTWLMSCRVLGRRMEELMCATVLRAAAEDGAALVHGDYLPTAKNAMVRDLYPRMGFEGGDGRYRFDLLRDRPPESPWITAIAVSVR